MNESHDVNFVVKKTINLTLKRNSKLTIKNFIASGATLVRILATDYGRPISHPIFPSIGG